MLIVAVYVSGVPCEHESVIDHVALGELLSVIDWNIVTFCPSTSVSTAEVVDAVPPTDTVVEEVPVCVQSPVEVPDVV